MGLYNGAPCIVIPVAQTKAGRPRDPHLDEALLRAAREVFLDRGYQHASLSEVARHAGVGTPAIYRRWRTKADMAIDIVTAAVSADPIPDTGDIRRDLIAFFRLRLATWSSRIFQQVLLPVVIDAFADPTLADRIRRRFLEYREPATEARVRRAIAAGQLRKDTDPHVLIDIVNGPLLMPVLFSRTMPHPDDAESIIDHMLEGFGPRSG